MRKSIETSNPVNESRITKSCRYVEKLLQELNTKSRKISLVMADDEFGDVDMDKLGILDELAEAIEGAINILAKL